MTKGQAFGAIVMWLFWLWFAIRDWRKWRALQEPGPKARNRAIFSSAMVVFLAVAFLWVEFR